MSSISCPNTNTGTADGWLARGGNTEGMTVVCVFAKVSGGEPQRTIEVSVSSANAPEELDRAMEGLMMVCVSSREAECSLWRPGWCTVRGLVEQHLCLILLCLFGLLDLYSITGSAESGGRESQRTTEVSVFSANAPGGLGWASGPCGPG